MNSSFGAARPSTCVWLSRPSRRPDFSFFRGFSSSGAVYAVCDNPAVSTFQLDEPVDDQIYETEPPSVLQQDDVPSK